MFQTCVVGYCKHYFSMLHMLRFDVCRHACVEEKGEEIPDVACCTQHGSQHDRNIVTT
jgi:hypothetical protein